MAPVFGMVSLVGVALGTASCWGEPFQLAPIVGTSSTGTSSVTGTGVVTTGAVATITGTGGVTGAATTAVPMDTGSTGAAGESGDGPIPSPYGENCQEVRKPADADLFLYGMYPDQNQDYRTLADDRLEVSQYGSASKRILLNFFLVPESAPGYTIAAAFLELQLIRAQDYGGVLNLHRLLERPWEERTATWNEFTAGQPWTTPGGDFEPEVFASAAANPDVVGQKIVWDVTTEAQRMFAGGPNHGWMLKEQGEPEGGAGLTYVFPGRDTTLDGEEGPILSIHFCN